MKTSSPAGPSPNTSAHVPAVLPPAPSQAARSSGVRSPGRAARRLMSSSGTACANARRAPGEWSRAVGIMPTSFSTWTMTTVRAVSVSRRCRRRAAKARASASRFAAEKADRISWATPSRSSARGKRAGSRFTQAGA